MAESSPSKQEIMGVLKDLTTELRDRFKVRRIGVFGSTVKNQRRPDSDVDILVEFETPISGFLFVHLRDYLSECLGVKVDLVTPPALHPLIRDRIMQEVVYV
jgi:predicted nucleotidyltransferase